MEKIPEYIEIFISPGNHDASRKALPQPAIPEGYLTGMQGKKNIHSVGSPCLLSLHGVEVLMYHGRSLDDIIGVVPGMDHDHPEKAMRLLHAKPPFSSSIRRKNHAVPRKPRLPSHR